MADTSYKKKYSTFNEALNHVQKDIYGKDMRVAICDALAFLNELYVLDSNQIKKVVYEYVSTHKEEIAELAKYDDTEIIKGLSQKADKSTTFTKNEIIKDFRVPNARGLGAIGDGQNDDTERIQAMIDKYDEVYLPTGDYVISYLKVTKSTKIYGDGPGKTILKVTSDNSDSKYAINIGTKDAEANKCVLRDFAIEGVANTQGICGGISLYNTSNSVIDNVLIRKMWSHGISIASKALDNKLSNITSMNNYRCGLYNIGYGNSIVNAQFSQNIIHGMSTHAGGFMVSNSKSWGNREHGFAINPSANEVAYAIQLSNCESQQNGGDGLHMTGECVGCTITGFHTTGNNYISQSRISPTTNILHSVGITVSGHDNYIQASTVAGYIGNNWNAIEEASVNIEEFNTYNNTVEIKAIGARSQSHVYDLYFNESYSDYQFQEYKKFKQSYSNPLNSVNINGIEQIDKSMTAITASDTKVNSSLRRTTTTDEDGTLNLTVSGLSNIQARSLDDLIEDGEIYVSPSSADLALARLYGIKPASDDKILYIRLKASVSSFRHIGIFVEFIYYLNDGPSTAKRYRCEVDNIKSTCIFGTQTENRYIAIDLLDLSTIDGEIKSIKSIQPIIVMTKLTEDCEDEETIHIKEFSYKLVK